MYNLILNKLVSMATSLELKQHLNGLYLYCKTVLDIFSFKLNKYHIEDSGCLMLKEKRSSIKITNAIQDHGGPKEGGRRLSRGSYRS